ncbi:unnamed protein product, partial [Ectocarpus sp. 12 AP-2014]
PCLCRAFFLPDSVVFLWVCPWRGDRAGDGWRGRTNDRFIERCASSTTNAVRPPVIRFFVVACRAVACSLVGLSGFGFDPSVRSSFRVRFESVPSCSQRPPAHVCTHSLANVSISCLFP